MESLIIEDLSVSFPTRGGGRKDVLNNVSFEVIPGEVLGLVGESGSGKTMISLAITRLLPPQCKPYLR